MDKALKQRLVGATVLIILAVIVLPMLLSGRSDTLSTESRKIELPPTPKELSFETRRFPVGIPDKPAVSTPQESTGAQIDDQETDAGEASDILGQELPTPVDPQPEVDSGEADKVAVTEHDTPVSVAEETDTAVAPAVVTTVIVAPLGDTGMIEPVPAVDLRGEPRYLVQVASFSSEKRASTMATGLRAQNMSVVMDVVDRTAGRLHRVRVGPFVERSEADAAVARIRAMNKDLSPRVMDTRPGDSAPVSTPSDPLVRWVVQVGSYSKAEMAESEAERMRLLGLSAFSEKVSSASGIVYKVRIGPDIDRSKAVQLAKEIKTRHNIDGFVTTQEH